MTVAELRARLERVPGDMRVVVDGYEGGYADLTPERVVVESVIVNCFAGWDNYGPHAPETEAAWANGEPVAELALLLSRNEIHSP